ncbi:hypothetical protein [uncultured Novosphingobium sp.]|uniref:hypothetical protein n=1 Tax=uncultured Novosphingobium sp. TaxID=292277 RepID=UPI002594B7AD|nr:hypothetical protein [uncultured Novosphingobium sp.]
MTLLQQASAAANDNAGIKLMLWPDGTWCWHDDYRPADYAHMSGDFEIIDMEGMPAVQRLPAQYFGAQHFGAHHLLAEHPALPSGIGDDMGMTPLQPAGEV